MGSCCSCACWGTGKGYMVTVLTLTIFNLIWNIVAIAPDVAWMYQGAAYSGASTDDSYSYSYAFILSLSKAVSLFLPLPFRT